MTQIDNIKWFCISYMNYRTNMLQYDEPVFSPEQWTDAYIARNPTENIDKQKFLETYGHRENS